MTKLKEHSREICTVTVNVEKEANMSNSSSCHFDQVSAISKEMTPRRRTSFLIAETEQLLESTPSRKNSCEDSVDFSSK